MKAAFGVRFFAADFFAGAFFAALFLPALFFAAPFLAAPPFLAADFLPADFFFAVAIRSLLSGVIGAIASGNYRPTRHKVNRSFPRAIALLIGKSRFFRGKIAVAAGHAPLGRIVRRPRDAHRCAASRARARRERTR